MRTNASRKLIAIIDSIKMIIYDAQGRKIINKAQELDLTLEKHPHHIREKSRSHYKNKSNPGSLFEPHTLPKDREHQEAARTVTEHLEKIINNIQNQYQELIIVAEPQMLGYVRHYLKNNLKKIITKEFAKDLIHHNIKSIEKVVFS